MHMIPLSNTGKIIERKFGMGALGKISAFCLAPH